MALIKDGNVIRTYEEQVDHLTEAHRAQLTVNENVQRQIGDILASSNINGFNLVRFSFKKSGTFYKISNSTLTVSANNWQTGDYIQIYSNDTNDIPAYGYMKSSNVVEIAYAGDFTKDYNALIARNVTTNSEVAVSLVLTPFDGSSLLDYDANINKNQVFNVLQDLLYDGARTQYVSFDLNNDDEFNFVYIGAQAKGLNGVDGKDYLLSSKVYSFGDYDGTDDLDMYGEGAYYPVNTFNRTPVVGDKFLCQANTTYKNATVSYIGIVTIDMVQNDNAYWEGVLYRITGLDGKDGENGQGWADVTSIKENDPSNETLAADSTGITVTSTVTVTTPTETYEIPSVMKIPVVGSSTVVIDVAADGKTFSIHLDANTLNKIQKALQLPVPQPLGNYIVTAQSTNPSNNPTQQIYKIESNTFDYEKMEAEGIFDLAYKLSTIDDGATLNIDGTIEEA